MAGRSQFGAVKEEFGAVREDFVGFSTVSEFVASLKSAVQNAEAEDILKMEIEGKKIENELLRENLRIEELEKLRLEKECGDLKELASRLREERDVLRDRLKEKEDLEELDCHLREERDVLRNRLKENEDLKELAGHLREECDVLRNRLKENEDLKESACRLREEHDVLRNRLKENEDLKELACHLREERDVLRNRLKENEDYYQNKIMKLKRKNYELECQKPRAEIDVDIYRSRIKELEGKISSLGKDASVTAETNGGKRKVIRENSLRSEALPETNTNPSDGSSHRKRREDRAVILDSDDASHESASEMVAKRQLEKAHSGKIVAEHEREVHECTSDMEIEKDASVNLTTAETNAVTGCPISPNSTMASANPPATSSRYENQKRRDWNTFCQYLRNHRPPLSLSMCSGANVLEFLRYLDQFGKTKVHNQTCSFFGLPSPPAPCPCPLRQAWGSLDALIGRLRAAYEEHSGTYKGNPFGARAVRIFLREVRDFQAKARGVSNIKKRKRPKS